MLSRDQLVRAAAEGGFQADAGMQGHPPGASGLKWKALNVKKLARTAVTGAARFSLAGLLLLVTTHSPKPPSPTHLRS
jgi:hypothetical protein